MTFFLESHIDSTKIILHPNQSACGQIVAVHHLWEVVCGHRVMHFRHVAGKHIWGHGFLRGILGQSCNQDGSLHDTWGLDMLMLVQPTVSVAVVLHKH
jgi:hypothetical protein